MRWACEAGINQQPKEGETKHNQEARAGSSTRGLPDCLQIVLIVPVLANVVILTLGAMAGSGQRRKVKNIAKQPNTIRKQNQVSVWYSFEKQKKKQEGFNPPRLFCSSRWAFPTVWRK